MPTWYAEHFEDVLEEDLESIMLEDFSVEAQDGSCYEVSKQLVRLHTELLHGSTAMLENLRATAPPAAAVGTSRRERVRSQRVGRGAQFKCSSW